MREPAGLPGTFTYKQAREAGVSDRQLYEMRDNSQIEVVGRGLYRRTDFEPADLDLVEIAHRATDATICLVSALARHALTDANPSTIDIAVPRDRRRPNVRAPVSWHQFDPVTFAVGRTELHVDSETTIGLYNPERSLVDVFRLRHREGQEVAHEALRRWLDGRGAQPSALLAVAANFPHAESGLRHALEVLL